MPRGLSERGGASLKSDVLKMQSLHCIWKPHPLVKCLAMSCARFKVGLFPVTLQQSLSCLKNGPDWPTCSMIAYLYFFNQLQCCCGKHGVLLVQLQKQLDEVCHNHAPSKHTSIITSQIRFANDNFTHILLDCNGMISKEALGLTVGDYPELCNWPTSDMLSRRSTVVVPN